MPDLKSLDNVYMIVGFLAPGLIFVFVRSQFLTGRSPPHSEALLSYLIVSVCYYALMLPVVDYVISIRQPGYFKALVWSGLVLVGPAALGAVAGVISKEGYIRRHLIRIGLNPVHVMPTAWDWKFGSSKEQWVLVTLKDGTKFAGYCGVESFMSSDPRERDIYIERIYDWNDGEPWKPRGETGVLIAGSEIRTIEFWPYNDLETAQ